MKYTLFDSCVYLHFLIKGSTAVNIKISKYPIAIKLSDGSIIGSTHTCNLDTPWLSQEMRKAHPVSGLEHLSLISTKTFCEAGCTAVFDKLEC